MLAPGQKVTATASYAISQADIDNGHVANSATSEGSPPGGGTTTPPEPAETDTPLPPAPSITIVKTADASAVSSPAEPGQLIVYHFEAQNTGNVTLTAVVIRDELPGLSELSYSWPAEDKPGMLEPGETVTATASYPLTQADIDAGQVENSATSEGTPPGGGTVTPPEPAKTRTPLTPAPTPTPPVPTPTPPAPTPTPPVPTPTPPAPTPAPPSCGTPNPAPSAGGAVTAASPALRNAPAAPVYALTALGAGLAGIITEATGPLAGQVFLACGSKPPREVPPPKPPLHPLAVTGAEMPWLFPVGALALILGGSLAVVAGSRRSHRSRAAAAAGVGGAAAADAGSTAAAGGAAAGAAGSGGPAGSAGGDGGGAA